MTKARPSFPLASAVACQDCDVVFDGSELSCPKCGSEISGHAVRNGAAARLIAAQREQLVECEAVLLTIAKRNHGRSSELAARMVDRIREGRGQYTPPAPAPVAAKAASL